MTDNLLHALLTDLEASANFDGAECARAAQDLKWIDGATDEQVVELMGALAEATGIDAPAREPYLSQILVRLVQRARGLELGASDERLAELLRQTIGRLYTRLGPPSGCRHHLLSVLVALGGDDALRMFTDRMVHDPPAAEAAAVAVLTPFFRKGNASSATPLFPRLLDGLAHSHLAAPILDLANFMTREDLVDTHPARNRVEELSLLLRNLAQRLSLLEENPAASGDSPEELSDKVDQCVSLAVSLCDALALIGDTSVVGSINQALELRHRRLRTEAAAALVRLGEENGKNELLGMAAEPVARLRTLAYAEELDLLEEIDPQFTTAEARAEAALSLHLAQPTQLGFPPNSCELIDHREHYWPGFDDLVECFLFRFVYLLGENSYSNIGIVIEDEAQSLMSDLCDLPPDDIYAVFAGWQAEHEEIYETDARMLSEAQRVEVARLERRLRDDGCQAISAVTLGSFFGERVLVAQAEKDATRGLAVCDSCDAYWYPTGGRSRALGPREVYSIYKGRKLLRSFND